MSSWPYDPNLPQFPNSLPPVTPKPIGLSLADLLKAMEPQPKPIGFGSLLGDQFSLEALQAKRPRIFVSYQHSSDRPYYEEFSRIFHEEYESVYDNSLRDSIDSENSEYVIQQIREKYITGTSCTIVLIGPTSFQRKFVDWEIKATLDKEHGLIGIQLPNVVPSWNGQVVVPTRFNANINSGYAVWQGISWQQLIANPASLKQHVADACNRPKDRIINPWEIKKQNG